MPVGSGSASPPRSNDFRSLAQGIALPYGIYDPQANRGSVFIGVSHETSALAVTSIYGWWRREGHRRYPNAQHLLILADTGGSKLRLAARLEGPTPAASR